MRPKIAIFLFILVFFQSFNYAKTNNNWVFQKKDKNVTVYLRDVPGTDLKEFKGVMYVRGTRLSSLVAAFDDTSSYTRWMHRCIYSKLLNKMNEYERITYTVTHAPWPATDRDTVVYSLMRQDPESLTVTITIIGRPDYIPAVKKRVRIPLMNAVWTFKPMDSGIIMVSYQVVTDPGGWLPTQFINVSIIDLPLITMQKLRDIITENRYASATINEITEPQIN